MTKKSTYQELEKTVKELKQDDARLESLLTLIQMGDASEDEIRVFALDSVVSLTESKAGYLHFFDQDNQTLSLVSWSKEVMKICKAEKTPHYPLAEAGIWADSVRLRKPVVHNDYHAVPEKKGYPEGHFNVIRHLSVPVFDNDNVVAVAGVGNKLTHYDGNDIRQTMLFMNNMWSILKQKRAESEKKRVIIELKEALAEVKTLSGLIPICASCKNIRDDKGYWSNVEAYIGTHSDAEFSHSICPECRTHLYPELYPEEAEDE